MTTDTPSCFAALAATALAIALAGCAGGSTRLVGVGVSETDDPAQLARLTEDWSRPVMLRAVDGISIDAFRFGPPLRTYEFAVRPGHHVLWLASPPAILGASPIPVGTIRCYVMEADVEPGRLYRLMEERSSKTALLLDDKDQVTGQAAAFDEFWTGFSTCHWP